MELRAILAVVIRRWWLIALPALAALAYAVYGYLKTPQTGGFATSIRFTAAQPPDAQGASIENSAYYQWLTSEYVVNGLTDWVTTNSFAEAVSQELAVNGVSISAGQLQGVMVPDNARSVMVVSISWGDEKQLQAIAAAVGAVLVNRSREAFPQLEATGVEVKPLDTPVISAVPPPLTARLNPLIRFGLGLVAGVALAFLVEYLDPTVRTRADVQALGIAILAEVPSRNRR
jgi:capsular polysaccharide biosynthesis protein